MPLNVALNTARSSIDATSVQTSVISRNVSGVHQDSYSRKNAALATNPGSGVYVASIQRATDNGLFRHMLAATGDSAKQSAIYSALDALSGATVDDPQNDHSPAAKLSALSTALQQYSISPDNTTLAQSFVTSAQKLAESLNAATDQTQQTREQADADMATSVSTINSLLQQFGTLNTAIIKGTITGSDVTDYQDMRDNVLSKLSEQIGITVETRANNDEAIYTDSGVTLFETTARAVTFTPKYTYAATVTGNDVYIDGVAVTGASAPMPIQSGKLAGAAEIRDKSTVTYQGQLDEIARGLIEAFAEKDPSATPTLPTRAGLFTDNNTSTMPTTGVINVGLAGRIQVNKLVDPDQGGNANLIRDGGINGAGYVYNSTGAASYSGRLGALASALKTSRTFDPAALADPTGTLSDFASSSTSWLEAQRTAANDSSTYQSTLVQRSTEALSNATGVNMDDEMIVMQQLERTYAASSKLIAAVDTMLQNLLTAVSTATA